MSIYRLLLISCDGIMILSLFQTIFKVIINAALYKNVNFNTSNEIMLVTVTTLMNFQTQYKVKITVLHLVNKHIQCTHNFIIS